MNNLIPVIAIDGPSASGKGTVAQKVAQLLGFHYLDSGALYRIVAYAAQLQTIAWDNAEALGALPHPAQGLLVSKVLYNELGGHSAEHADPERAFLRRVGRRRIVALRSGAVALNGGR